MSEKLAELRGPDSSFPVAVERKPERLSAYDFSATIRGGSYQFGISPELCARKLREIADAVESGRLVLQSGRVVSTCNREDYPMTFLRLVFHERNSEPVKPKQEEQKP